MSANPVLYVALRIIQTLSPLPEDAAAGVAAGISLESAPRQEKPADPQQQPSEPKPQPAEPIPAPEKPADPPVRALGESEAKGFLARLKPRLEAKEPRVRKEAVDELATVSSEVFVAPLTRLLRHDDPQLAAAAIRALAVQPAESARGQLLCFLKDAKIARDEVRGREAVKVLGGIGYGKNGFAVLRKTFDATRPVIQREILLAFAAQKDKRAFSLMVDTMEEPIPASVDAASNPPASYWQERWQSWQQLKLPAQRSLESLTGLKLDTAQAWRDWAKSDSARKLGFTYKKGDAP